MTLYMRTQEIKVLPPIQELVEGHGDWLCDNRGSFLEYFAEIENRGDSAEYLGVTVDGTQVSARIGHTKKGRLLAVFSYLKAPEETYVVTAFDCILSDFGLHPESINQVGGMKQQLYEKAFRVNERSRKATDPMEQGKFRAAAAAIRKAAERL